VIDIEMMSRGNVWRRIVKIRIFSWFCSKTSNELSGEKGTRFHRGDTHSAEPTFLSLLAIDPSAARTFFPESTAKSCG
jgi:hypothetical protein